MAVQLSPRVILRVIIVLTLLGVLLAGSLAPSWFGGASERPESATTTTEPSPPSTTLVPVDLQRRPSTTEHLATFHVGTMLDGRPHMISSDDPGTFFLGGAPLEIRRIEGLTANGDCEGLREALERWLPIGAALEELEELEVATHEGDEGDDLAQMVELSRQASVYARAAFDGLAMVGCG